MNSGLIVANATPNVLSRGKSNDCQEGRRFSKKYYKHDEGYFISCDAYMIKWNTI